MNRRIIATLLTIAICVSLGSCSKSEATLSAETLISAIGEVTLDSGSAIVQAEKAVEALSGMDAWRLEGEETLTLARATYNELLVAEVEETIAAIGTVRLSSSTFGAIESARQAYDALSGELQSAVENASVLTAAEETYIQLQVDDVEQAIASIGKVTLSSGRKITIARNAYEKCDSDIQNKVSNLVVLEEAEAKYAELQIKDIETAISAIGTVALDSKAKIEKARATYNSYGTSISEQVSNLDVLVAAEERYAELEVEYVVEQINGIGEVTLEDEEQISAVKAAYDGLTYDQKNAVTNSEMLLSSVAELERLKIEAEEKAREEALSKMRVTEDKVEGVTWYQSKKHPQYANSRSFIFPYIGVFREYGSMAVLRLKLNYTDDDYIFFETVIFLVDGVRYEIEVEYFDVNREVFLGGVCEAADIVPTLDQIAMLRAIAESDETIVRFEGDRGKYDLTVSNSDKEGIAEVLDAYEYLE